MPAKEENDHHNKTYDHFAKYDHVTRTSDFSFVLLEPNQLKHLVANSFCRHVRQIGAIPLLTYLLCKGVNHDNHPLEVCFV
jgi:hypothetical protein